MTNETATPNAPREAGETVYIVTNIRTPQGVSVAKTPPAYEPPRTYRASSINISTLKIGPERTEHRPEMIRCASTSFHINAIDDAKPHANGLEARRLSDDDSKAFREMERRHAEQELAARKERREFLAAAVKRSRRVKRTDCANLQSPSLH